MSRQLRRFGLKVEGVYFIRGREYLESLRVNDERRYPIGGYLHYMVATNQGTLQVMTLPGFVFDGRSGPKIVDWYAPNLGTLEEIVCWHAHDCNGYGLDLGFADTNLLLFAMLRDFANYRTSKASIIQLAVSLSDSWYGEPKEGEWCVCNKGKVKTVWIPKAGG